MAPPRDPDATAPSTAPEAEDEDVEEEILSPAARAERDNPRPPPPAAPPTPPPRSHGRSNTQPFFPTGRPQMYSAHPRPATYAAPNYYGSPPPPPVIIVTQPTFMENMVATPPALHSPHGFGRPHHHHNHYHQPPPQVQPIQIEEPPPTSPPTRHTDVLLHLTLCTCVAGHKREDLGCFARECIGTADLTAGPFKCDVSAGGLLGLMGAVVTWPFICCLGTTWGTCKFCCTRRRRGGRDGDGRAWE